MLNISVIGLSYNTSLELKEDRTFADFAACSSHSFTCNKNFFFPVVYHIINLENCRVKPDPVYNFELNYYLISERACSVTKEEKEGRRRNQEELT